MQCMQLYKNFPKRNRLGRNVYGDVSSCSMQLQTFGTVCQMAQNGGKENEFCKLFVIKTTRRFTRYLVADFHEI